MATWDVSGTASGPDKEATMIYVIAVVAALGTTFYWALCKTAARADAAMVGWYRQPQPPDEELDELVASVVEDVRGIGGMRDLRND